MGLLERIRLFNPRLVVQAQGWRAGFLMPAARWPPLVARGCSCLPPETAQNSKAGVWMASAHSPALPVC